MSDSGDTSTSSPTSMSGRWLVSVKLKKLAVSSSSSFSAQKLRGGGVNRDCMYSSTPCKPFMHDNEKAGLVFLVNQMRTDNLFSGDVPPSISDPRGILERLLKQLQNPVLDSTLSHTPTGLSVLDDLEWTDCERTSNMQTGSAFNDVGVAMGGVKKEEEEECVSFDDDFLTSDDLLGSCINPESISDQCLDQGSTKPILRVNHDHSYGQFVTPSDPSNSDSTHLLIAESPTHLSTEQPPPDYPFVTINPTHSLATPPVSTSSFSFDQILSSASSISLTPLTPSLLSRHSLPLLSLLTSSSQQLEAPPLSAGLVSTPSLSSPSLSPTTPAGDRQFPLSLSNLKSQSFFHSEAMPILSETTPTTGDTTPTSEGPPLFSKQVKKRKKSLKDSTKPLRKVRCGQCPECMSEPCGVCKFCLDSPKYGGTGKLRKACLRRRCSNVS